MDFYGWLGLITAVLSAAYILDREIFFYEGAHLGPRVQAWLYDRWSKKYDADKRESQLRDDEMLAAPLLEALYVHSSHRKGREHEGAGGLEPFVLDFAAGTGRLSVALMKRPEFSGRIIAMDLSLGMLEQAVEKLSRALSALDTSSGTGPAEDGRVEFLRYQTFPLPFADATFDAVCCLEVLELLPDMDAALAEMSRVLRPGGTLLTSRGTEASGRKAKVKSRAEFGALLAKNGFENYRIDVWWSLFDRVLAVKNGSSEPVRRRCLREVLQCPACGMIQWEDEWKCGNCGGELSVTREGIVLG